MRVIYLYIFFFEVGANFHLHLITGKQEGTGDSHLENKSGQPIDAQWDALELLQASSSSHAL